MASDDLARDGLLPRSDASEEVGDVGLAVVEFDPGIREEPLLHQGFGIKAHSIGSYARDALPVKRSPKTTPVDELGDYTAELLTV
jgi:hypothetical protein